MRPLTLDVAERVGLRVNGSPRGTVVDLAVPLVEE
jgi:hypothetical protein